MDIHDIRKVTVAGGGVLGSQIAYQSAYMGYEVTIWLRSEASVGRARPKLERLHEIYLDALERMESDPSAYAYGLIAKEEMSPENLEAARQRADRALASIRLTTGWDEAFGDADLVIEAVAEDPQQKQAFYEELQRHLCGHAVIATNSSTLLPSRFADATGRPERYLALHFANEIWKNPSAEIMGHDRCDPACFELVVQFASSIRMVPLKVLKEQPGYLLNSMLVPFLGAAEALWANGVASPEDIDRAWMLGTGAPAGPFRILDIVGLVTAYNIGLMKPQAQEEGTVENRIVTLLKEKIDAKETGVASGKGFYDYC